MFFEIKHIVSKPLGRDSLGRIPLVLLLKAIFSSGIVEPNVEHLGGEFRLFMDTMTIVTSVYIKLIVNPKWKKYEKCLHHKRATYAVTKSEANSW